MAKRKYARFGESTSMYECTKKSCKWQGTDEEKIIIPDKNGWDNYSCPKCGNIEFYGLLEKEVTDAN